MLFSGCLLAFRLLFKCRQFGMNDQQTAVQKQPERFRLLGLKPKGILKNFCYCFQAAFSSAGI